MTRAEVIEAVRFKLDEYSAFDSEEVFLMESGEKVKPITEIIDSQIDCACRELALLLPTKREILGITFFDDDLGGHGVITCPLGFAHLRRLSVESWRRDVTDTQGFFSINHPKYKEQRNIATRGRRDKPIALIDKGNNTIELYSVIKDKDTEATLDYTENIADLDAIQDMNIIDCIVLNTASKVFAIMDNMQGMQFMQAELKSKIETLTSR